MLTSKYPINLLVWWIIKDRMNTNFVLQINSDVHVTSNTNKRHYARARTESFGSQASDSYCF